MHTLQNINLKNWDLTDKLRRVDSDGNVLGSTFKRPPTVIITQGGWRFGSANKHTHE